MVSLKEIFLFSIAAAGVFAYMLLHFLGNFIGSELYTIFILCVFAYYGLLCFMIIHRSSHLEETFDLTNFSGTGWLVNSIGTLFAIIVICIVEEGLIGMATLMGTAMDDPLAVVQSALFIPWLIDMVTEGQSHIQELYYAWYLTFAVFSLILGIVAIGRYHKARKMIGLMEICKRENAAGDIMSADIFAEKITEPNQALIMSIPKEDMIPDEEEYDQLLRHTTAEQRAASLSELKLEALADPDPLSGLLADPLPEAEADPIPQYKPETKSEPMSRLTDDPFAELDAIPVPPYNPEPKPEPKPDPISRLTDDPFAELDAIPVPPYKPEPKPDPIPEPEPKPEPQYRECPFCGTQNAMVFRQCRYCGADLDEEAEETEEVDTDA